MGFTIRLNYTLPSGSQPIGGAEVYLVLDNNDTVVDAAVTGPDGYAVLVYRFLRNGTYAFHVYYPGNETFEPYNTSSIAFTVKSLATTITLVSTPSSGIVGSEIAVEAVLRDERGRPIAGETVMLYRWSGSEWVYVAENTTGSDGGVVVKWSESAASTYTYKLVYMGRDYVYNASESQNFTVTVEAQGVELNLTASPTTQFAGENVTLTARLVSNGTPVEGETIVFQAKIDDTWETIGSAVTGPDGYAFINATRWVSGTVYYRAYYPGSTTYSEAYSGEIAVTYEPRPVSLSAEFPRDMDVYDIEVFNITLVDGLNGTPIRNAVVSVALYGPDALIFPGSTGGDGVAHIGVMVSTEGVYTVTFAYGGNATYQGVNAYYYDALTVHASTIINVTGPSTVYVGDVFTLTIHLVSETNRSIGGALLGVRIYNGSVLVDSFNVTTNSTGYASITYSFAGAASYVFSITYNGTEIYYGSSANYTVTANRRPVNVEELSPSTITAPPGSSVEIAIRVVDALTDSPVSGAEVRVYVDDVYVATIYTNSTGYAVYGYDVEEGSHTIRLLVTGRVGAYIVYEEYSSEFTVNGALYGTSIEAYTLPGRVAVGEPFAIVAVLTSGGVPVGGETIEFYIVSGGETLVGTAVTNASGVAVLSGLLLGEPGNYTYHIVYPGSATYQASDTYIVVEAKYTAFIQLNTSYVVIDDTSIMVTLRARLLVNGRPVSNATIYFYKKGSWILLGTNTTDADGVATYSYIEDLTRLTGTTLTYRADYPGNASTYSSTEIETLALPPELLPTPEPPITPLMLLASLAAAIYLAARRRR